LTELRLNQPKFSQLESLSSLPALTALDCIWGLDLAELEMSDVSVQQLATLTGLR